MGAFQGIQGQVVGALGVEFENQGTEEGINHVSGFKFQVSSRGRGFQLET
jgi:hypothetical protein